MPTTIINAGDITNTHVSASAAISRSKLAQEGKKFLVPFEEFRIFDSASNAVLPNTAATDDLGFVLGTRGTSGNTIQTADAKNTTVTQKAAFRFWLPAEYDAAETIQLVSYGGMNTTVANGTATVDFSVYSQSIDDNTHSADLITTSAQTINSLTFAAQTFDVTATGLSNGNVLNCLMTVAITDSATGTAVIGQFTQVYFLLDVRG